MNTKLIALSADLITTASVSIAVNAAVDMFTPPALGPVARFGVKVGGKLVGGLVAMKAGEIVNKLITDALETTVAEEELESPSEDNN